MNGTIDDRYFEWLYSLVSPVRTQNLERSYWSLLKALYTKQFTWFVPNDDNRAADGRELRFEFIKEWGSDGIDASWMDLGCSILEMLIALADRAAYESENKSSGQWFWVFLENLGIDKFNDRAWNSQKEQVVERVLDRLVERKYKRNGEGGLFPLKYPPGDQRKVELWYQMSSYLLEGEYADIKPF